MNLIILISLAIVVVILSNTVVAGKKRLFHSTAVLLSIAILSYYNSLPAMAATESATPGAIKRFVSNEQQELEEDLNLTPGGGHYSGIEHAERTTGVEKAVSDSSIESTIEKYSSDYLTVAVANGSVKLSGQVKDKEIARHIVNQVKEIPGVYEVTYNLGLENKAL